MRDLLTPNKPMDAKLVDIRKMQMIFATHGMQEVIVSDNGTTFASQEFKEFMDNNL